jgi:ABC-type multidrug transport system ATPase subunit
MSEAILNALVQLFALISDLHEDTVISVREKDIVRSFLARHLNNELVQRYMSKFEHYLNEYTLERIEKNSVRDRKRTSLNAVRILGICEKINHELQQKQKIYVLVKLIDYISLGSEVTENELDFLESVADAFFVQNKEYCNIRNFIMGNTDAVCEKNRVLIIDDKTEHENSEFKFLYRENIKGNILFLHIHSTNTYILRYTGSADIYLNGQNIASGQSYIFDSGSSIRGSGISTIFYTEVVGIITETSFESRINLDANGVNLKFRNSDNGIHDLNFHEESGKLVGILGGSGVGKSTTLSILSGTLKPQSGEVLINGYNLYDEEERKHLKGVIGFVPQDDLLIEELTVFQNLYYNAKLCLSNLEEEKLIEVVNKTLIDFDLEETRNLKVGSPLKKIISGGQRKRVNIALELMREPTILFVDEPTSGLSSVDSEMVMNLLKAQTYKGKLVIVNIHQPNSDIYKMFDKIMIIDKGGYQVFYGNPTEAIVYFKHHSNYANPDEDQCVQCGNIDTDQVLQIVESKVVDERGRATRIRKVSPPEWAARLKESGLLKKYSGNGKRAVPQNNFSIPGLFKQSVIFFTRDILSKLADKQYILISLLGPPLLSLVLAYFTKFTKGDVYTFGDNENIPSYMFMCIITSLFFGLMISSEEIVKDRKILKRESFLNLSWFSYLNSKVMILFIISAIQTISFVIIGNLILGIKGMTLAYWLVLFTTSCTSNILGLNLSSAFNSVITIYILIPFFIIPQLLFSGVLVKFDKLHIGSPTTREFVPILGDLMTARWSFEALAVKQFRDNEYMKYIFDEKLNESKAEQGMSKINALLVLLNDSKEIEQKNIRDDNSTIEDLRQNYDVLNKYIVSLSSETGLTPGRWIDDLKINSSDSIKENAQRHLELTKKKFSAMLRKAMNRKDTISINLRKEIGAERYDNLKPEYHNSKLEEYIQASDKNVAIVGDKMILKSNPGFTRGTSKFGRSHFYAPYKKLGNKEFDTYKFNLAVIWIVTLLLYVALYFTLLSKGINYIGGLRFQKSET